MAGLLSAGRSQVSLAAEDSVSTGPGARGVPRRAHTAAKACIVAWTCRSTHGGGADDTARTDGDLARHAGRAPRRDGGRPADPHHYVGGPRHARQPLARHGGDPRPEYAA